MKLSEENDDVEYTNLMWNVKKWTVDTQKSVMDIMFQRCTNYPSLDIFNVLAKICMCENKDECKLYNYLEQRKYDLSGEKYMIMSEEKKWNKYRGDLKEENEKLEYKIADMLKAGD
jgi:hypothetical protein